MRMHQLPTMSDYLTVAAPLDNTPFYNSASKPEPVIDADFQTMLTDFIAEEYGDYRLRRRYYAATPEAILEKVQRACDNVYLTHAYTYQHLYDTTIADYNPIENYNMLEHEDTQNSGTDETTHDKGAQTDKTTTSIGTKTDTVNYGENTDTDIYGARNTTSDGTADKSPFETQDYQHVDKTHEQITEQSVTDRHTHSQRSDSTTFGGRSDSETVNQGERHDVDSLEHGHEIERNLTRSGNIGTTTTQMMLESERHVAAFNLVRVVANDLIQTLCICCEGVNF